MALHNKETIEARQNVVKKGAGVILYTFFAAIPFLGTLVASWVLFQLLGTVFVKSKTIGQDIILPLICSVIFVGYHYSYFTGNPSFSFKADPTYFYISPIIVFIIMLYGYRKGFIEA